MAAGLLLVLFFYTVRTIFLLLTIPPVITAHVLSFNYPGFKERDVKLKGEAYVEDSKIIIGVDFVNRGFQGHSAARVTSLQQLQLWDKTSGNITSFSTKFSFMCQELNEFNQIFLCSAQDMHMGMNLNSMNSSKIAHWIYNWNNYHDRIITYKSATLRLSVTCTQRDPSYGSTRQYISQS